LDKEHLLERLEFLNIKLETKIDNEILKSYMFFIITPFIEELLTLNRRGGGVGRPPL